MLNEGLSRPQGGELSGTEQPELQLKGNSWEFASDLRVLAAVRQALAERFYEAGWTEAELGNFPIAIDEAITNAIVHGNLRVTGRRKSPEDELYNQRLQQAMASELGKLKVRMEVNVRPELISIQVTDEGEGFTPPAPSTAYAAAEGEQEGGYGLTIMQGAADDIQFLRNMVTMTKRRHRV